MTLKINLKDGYGTGNLAEVTNAGELIIAGFGTSTNKSSFQSMTSPNVAYNFFPPVSGQQFFITSIVITSTASAVIQIYGATSPSTITVETLLFKLVTTASNQTPFVLSLPLPFGGFIPVLEGEFLNAQTDTATVNINIVGYYATKT